jgi:PAS domain S-box-containing protein
MLTLLLLIKGTKQFKEFNYLKQMTQLPPEPLLQSHATFILDCIACGVFTVDEDMKITYFNRTAEKITGVSQDDAIGYYCFEVLKANICEKTCVLRRSLETGTEFSHNEVNILRNDGKRIPVSICTAVLKDETGKKSAVLKLSRISPNMRSLKKRSNEAILMMILFPNTISYRKCLIFYST